MRTTLAAVAASLAVTAALGAQPVITAASVLLRDSEVKWGDAPPNLEKGASFAVISGDPSTGGPYVIRLKMPAGYKVAPHWHPTAENITVISGTFALGMGEKFDPAALKDFGPGSYGLMPAEMRHFAMARTAAIVQVHGIGPFALNYVNPWDDPSKRAAPAKSN